MIRVRGIPESAQGKIFEAFYQGDDSSSRKVEGTGLGLARLRRILTLVGGQIDFESSDKGTHFYLRFPQSLYPSRNKLDKKPVISEIPSRPITVLVVKITQLI